MQLKSILSIIFIKYSTRKQFLINATLHDYPSEHANRIISMHRILELNEKLKLASYKVNFKKYSLHFLKPSLPQSYMIRF
jgi:hypothetical protein